MSYTITKICSLSFDNAITRVTEELTKEGFGILTDIDVKATIKKKLDVDFRQYRILGACNPPLAFQALQAEDKIGTMLPCNIIVQEKEDKTIEISAIDPVASMQAVQNETVLDIAKRVRGKLQTVIDNI